MQNHSRLNRKRVLLALVLCLPLLAGAEALQFEALQLAMGDMGALKHELSPADPATQLSWSQLSNEQKTILAALGAEWDTLRPWQREKMLDIASEYPKLDGQQQLRVQRQLLKWSRMTPFERENARKRYQQFQSLSPEKKQALREKWKAHKKNTGADADEPDFDLAVP